MIKEVPFDLEKNKEVIAMLKYKQQLAEKIKQLEQKTEKDLLDIFDVDSVILVKRYTSDILNLLKG